MSPFTCSLLLAVLSTAPDDYNVLPADKQNPPNQMLHRYLVQEAHKALDRRLAAYEKLKTKEECLAYQKKQRRFFLKQLGGFPNRTA